MLWKTYSIIITASIIYSTADQISTGSAPNIIGSIFSIFIAVGVIGFAFGKKIGPHLFWHIYTVLAIVMFSLISALIIFMYVADPDTSLTWDIMLMLALSIPGYYALWQYTYKSKQIWS
jgi:hypothetical protein